MRKISAIVLAISILLTNASFAAIFKDTEGHWAKDYIEELTVKGVIAGDGAGNFNPDAYVTREQFLKMLLISACKDSDERSVLENPPAAEEGDASSPFSDVSKDRWSCYYIKKAYGTVIFTEEYGESFEPVKDITREEAAVWMSRALQLSAGEADFSDNELIGNKEMVGAAAAARLVNGFEDKSFRPGELLTRGQAAVMLSGASRLNAQMMLSYYPNIVKEFERDLDSDGANDAVKVSANETGYMLSVNGVSAIGGECDTEYNRYYIIDIDKDDEYKEIAVSEVNYGNMSLAVYRYTGNYLYLMGRIKTAGSLSVRTDATPIGDEWGAVSVNQDGTITANIGVQFVHTMLIRKQYKINDKMRLEATDGDYYTIGGYSDFTVVKETESPISDSEHPNISLTPGYTGKIVKTDLEHWIYIETGSGDSGWIYVDDEGKVNGEQLSYYLEGLFYAG